MPSCHPWKRWPSLDATYATSAPILTDSGRPRSSLYGLHASKIPRITDTWGRLIAAIRAISRRLTCSRTRPFRALGPFFQICTSSRPRVSPLKIAISSLLDKVNAIAAVVGLPDLAVLLELAPATDRAVPRQVGDGQACQRGAGALFREWESVSSRHSGRAYSESRELETVSLSELLDAGYDVYLTKPIQPRAIVQAVRGLAGSEASEASPIGRLTHPGRTVISPVGLSSV